MPQHLFKHAIWQEGDVEDANFRKLMPENKKMHSWIQECGDIAVNVLHTETSNPGHEAIWGSLVFRQNQKQRNARDVFHFYLSKELLVTSELEFEKDEDLDEAAILRQMQNASSSIELMMIMLGKMSNAILRKIDLFEERLHNLLWEIEEKNNKQTFEEIQSVRHEIFLWKHLVIGFLEIKMAIPEVFGKAVQEEPEFYRTSMRIDRCAMLVDSYEDEINNLVDMENVIASYRGNEIAKTLTVLATLFTPIMAFGGLWGMNFDNMPELHWSFGYPMALFLMVTTTVVLYIYLKRRGWIGDVLKTANPKSKYNG
ncbi:magnesium transporter CorA family protein [Planococcus sp. YIM B11945]|uniref:magnesium transporter CorA family protein n=1 Tax=Planococcus sp. YIM B11945 TaxID=3435410 RepID=UPI003D7D8860